jgi:cytosine/adenosine deaminase-related metal-dependent hydrolase
MVRLRSTATRSRVSEIARRSKPISPTSKVEDFGEAAILPGFVNCHSHLELTAMRGALDDVEHDFRSWLLKIQGLRSAMTDAEIEAAAIAGAREGAAAGATCFGDIGRNGEAGLNALKTVGLRGILFQETEFSPDNRTADEDFAKLGAKFEELKKEETELVRVGLSPHSTYTVSSRLFELIAQYAILNAISAYDPCGGGTRRDGAADKRSMGFSQRFTNDLDLSGKARIAHRSNISSDSVFYQQGRCWRIA